MKVAADSCTNPDIVISPRKKEATPVARTHSGSGDEDVHSKFSDLSESSNDPPHDDDEGGGKHAPRRSNPPIRANRSDDYENFEKMLRNKHSKACKAMSVCME